MKEGCATQLTAIPVVCGESDASVSLSEGHNVVLDACHLSERARWHALQGPNSQHRKICVVFDIPLQTVRDRCLKANRMPIMEVRRMWKAFQKSKPTIGELKQLGFDEVYFLWCGLTQSPGDFFRDK